MDQQTTNNIDTWAIVEVMGHTKLAGRARTEAFGGTVMLRVDVPELPERRERRTTHWNEETGERLRAPAEVEDVRPSEPAYTRYFGLQAIFSITPCDEAAAVAATERMRKTPAKVVRLAPALAGPADPPTDGGDGAARQTDIGDDAVVDDFEDDDDDED